MKRSINHPYAAALCRRLAALLIALTLVVAANAGAATGTGLELFAPADNHASGQPAVELAQAATSAPADVQQTIEDLRQELEEQRQQLNAERARTEQLEQRLDAVLKQSKQQPANLATTPANVAPVAPVSPSTVLTALKAKVGHGAEITPGAPGQQTEADIYNNGFYLKTRTGNFSIYFNGLFQPRFTFFKPNSVTKMGSNDPAIDNFDIWLGRFAISGNAFDPSIKYFLQLQGTTTGNGTGISMLDWFTSKTVNPYFTIQMGRYWVPYTYEYYDNPANYLLPDLSAAEYAFTLGQGDGVMLTGAVDKLNYNLSVTSTIPGLDVAPVQNFGSKLAYVGNLHYDILAPYGYTETDPSLEGATKPELTLWVSGMYNPVQYNSTFSNEMAGDRTYGSNMEVLFRYRYFTFQGIGYYRRTLQHMGLPSYDSWGYGEQAGYYLVPGRWELAERISSIMWGQQEIPRIGGTENNWWAGPSNFPYQTLTEYTAGLNYYLMGNHAKLQLAYSYLAGRSFSQGSFGANRVFLQSTLQF